MYTYTHCLFGACVAGWALKDEERWQPMVAITLAAGVPDFAMVAQFAYGFVTGQTDALKYWWPATSGYNAVCHSFLVILAVAVAAEFYFHFSHGARHFKRLARWLIWVWFSHPVIDCLSHRNMTESFDYMWPLPVRLSRQTGLWDYRTPGTLKPGPAEVCIDLLLFAVVVWQTAAYINQRRQKKEAAITEAEPA